MTTIAIDFGTSNTVVSLLESDTQTPTTLRFPAISRVFRLTSAKGETLEIPVVPTLAFVKPQNQLVLGQQVRSHRLGLSQPDRLFKTFKRDLVADFQPPPRQIDGQSYSAATIAEQFLQQLWQSILAQQIQPSQVIFTVPVGAFERYLDWFRAVADQLEIPQIQLVDEPTAAALGYAVQHPGAIVLVIDFGGGTLDLSLVRTEASRDDSQVRQAEVLAKSDAYVGGEDVDIWIVEDYLQQKGSSREAVGQVGWQNLLELAERLKIRLSSHEEATESWLDEESFTAYDLKLPRSHLETILENRQFLEQLRQALDEVLTIALGKGISKSDIEQVLLVGGSCLIPAVQQLILSYFGRQRVKLDRPFEAVAHGALVVTQLSSLGDYLRHSYAIRTWEPYAQMDVYYSLFERGTKYPCQRSQPMILRVANPGQKEIRLDIGEVADITQAEIAYDASGRMTSTHLQRSQAYRSLEANGDQVCVAHLNPPGQTGVDRISVEFEVNDQRTLIATVRDLLTDQVLVEKGAIAKLE